MVLELVMLGVVKDLEEDFSASVEPIVDDDMTGDTAVVVDDILLVFIGGFLEVVTVPIEIVVDVELKDDAFIFVDDISDALVGVLDSVITDEDGENIVELFDGDDIVDVADVNLFVTVDDLSLGVSCVGQCEDIIYELELRKLEPDVVELKNFADAVDETFPVSDDCDDAAEGMDDGAAVISDEVDVTEEEDVVVVTVVVEVVPEQLYSLTSSMAMSLM